MNIIFGPITSRRFGVSLGIDLSPSKKQCNFDCLYCELSPALTVDKQDDILSVEEIISALKDALEIHKNIDVITLTANGEPTLYPYLDELIMEIDKIKGKAQTLILTNSANLVDKNIYNSLLKLDQVKLSLDAVSKEIFTKIDRPHEEIDIDKLITSVISFSHEFQGELFMEILFVNGLNDSKEEIALLNTVLKRIKASRIDLGTIDRPSAYEVAKVPYNRLIEISKEFDKELAIHIASRNRQTPTLSHYSKDEIINTLDKRPLTQIDIENLFDSESRSALEALIKEGKIIIKTQGNLEFYIPKNNQVRKLKKK